MHFTSITTSGTHQRPPSPLVFRKTPQQPSPQIHDEWSSLLTSAWTLFFLTAAVRIHHWWYRSWVVGCVWIHWWHRTQYFQKDVADYTWILLKSAATLRPHPSCAYWHLHIELQLATPIAFPSLKSSQQPRHITNPPQMLQGHAISWSFIYQHPPQPQFSISQSQQKAQSNNASIIRNTNEKQP